MENWKKTSAQAQTPLQKIALKSHYTSAILVCITVRLAEDRVSWRAGNADGVKIFHEASQKYAELKRGVQKGSLNCPELPTWPCAQCN